MTTNAEALDALEELHEQLLLAHQAAIRVEDMRRIVRALGEVSAEIKTVLIRKMEDANAAYRPNFADIIQVKEDLDAIKAEIKHITSVVKTATQVVSAVGKVIGMIAPFALA